MAILSLKELAAAVVAVGGISGSALTLNALHEPRGEAEKVRVELMQVTGGIQTDMRVDRILKMAAESANSGSPQWLCEAIEKELIALCTDDPDHYLCADDPRREIKAKAGC